MYAWPSSSVQCAWTPTPTPPPWLSLSTSVYSLDDGAPPSHTRARAHTHTHTHAHPFYLPPKVFSGIGLAVFIGASSFFTHNKVVKEKLTEQKRQHNRKKSGTDQLTEADEVS